jgi:predicted oxidoreductase
LTDSSSSIKYGRIISGVHSRTVKGNFVKNEDGPAAVTGGRIVHKKSLSGSGINQNLTGRRMRRMIRKSEDLPEKSACFVTCGIIAVVDYRQL